MSVTRFVAIRCDVLLLAASMLCLQGGCAKQPPASKAFAVKGVLTADGQPVPNASIAFHRLKQDDSPLFCPVALTRSDGTFDLTSFAAMDGAPPGDYIVTVLWRDPTVEIDECECPDPIQHDVFRGRYASAATSPLRATVRPMTNIIPLDTNLPPKKERATETVTDQQE